MAKAAPFKHIFDKEYFREHYFSTTGDFSKKELLRNKNWFHGWFRTLQKDYDFTDGTGKKALEIGCAIGAAAEILYERHFQILATDISPYAVKKAQKLLPHLTFKVLDVEKKKALKDTFDLVYAFEVIEHLPDPEKAIQNIYDLLKPDGVVIFSTPYPYDYVYNDKTHINVRYPMEWIDLMRKAGFTILRYRHKTFIPFFYRFSKYLHFIFPFGIPSPYVNSHVFLYGMKKG